jgi:PIF1-like helicase/Helitron helicase-like domain at N-terminus
MQKQYQDSIALVVEFGRPDLFITFTTNPKWPEITENLLPGQTSSERPDIVSRVFSLKVDELIKDIMVKKIFGNAIAYTYTIEFQKRGLPHMHLLVILGANDKIHGDPEQIDKFICAEIPDPVADSHMYALVKQHMIHGPCGPLGSDSPCMDESGRCKKFFPKTLQEFTSAPPNSYPAYQRNSQHTVTINGHVLDSGWVVPYNRTLSLKYNAHINIEVCSSIEGIKYLYKYCFKGHARANLVVTSNEPISHNEIQQFLDTRYVAAPEAAWRIQTHALCSRSHSVFQLGIHLPFEQLITFAVGDELAAVQNARNTHLTAWFQLNQIDPDARLIFYGELPKYFVFNNRTYKWTRRQRGVVLGRICFVNPTQGEKFFLRLLLLHVKGATSFEFLRTVNGVIHTTFRDAANALGLLEDDSEWVRTLTEAAVHAMPHQMRQLFVNILIFCIPSNPIELWEQFKNEFSRGLHPEQERAYDIALAIINNKLAEFQKSNSTFGLPEPSTAMDNITNQIDEPIQILPLTIPNDEQAAAINQVLEAIEQGNGGCFFLDGPGGTGKTFVYNNLITRLQLQNIPVIATASTGIAATLLQRGRTVHSTFRVPIPTENTSVSLLSVQHQAAVKIKSAKLIIWDEAPMSHKDVLDVVHRFLQDLHQNSLPFGGVVILLGGDFRQVLPVITKGSRATCVNASILKSPLWSHFRVLKLTQNMRAGPGEQEFAQWLLEVGNGNTGPSLAVPQECLPTRESIIDNVFQNPEQLMSGKRAILCPHNTSQHLLNDQVLGRLQGTAKIYLSSDKAVVDNDELNMYPHELLHELTPGGMPPHKLTLKVGAIIMLLRNLNVSEGLCNGSRLQVTSLGNNLITATHLTGPYEGIPIMIPRVNTSSDVKNYPFKLSRRQFPVQLSYCMTINKSQGQTFERIGISLQNPVFSHGQLYVALSRCRSLQSITMVIPSNTNETPNIVYPEALNQ